MKTLAILLRLETASHRKRMMGIFRQIGAAGQYDIRIISGEDSLCELLSPPNASERPDGIISGVPYSERTKKAIAESGKTDTTSLSDYLKCLPRPAAFFAAWDGRTADVIHAAHWANLRIPEDIAILGVDDDELICEHTVPPLSSIKTDADAT